MRSILLRKKAVLLQVQRKEIESHLQEAVRPHVDLAFAKLTSTQEELKRSQDLTSKLNERFNGLERQLKLFEAKFNDQQLIIRRLSSNYHGEKVNALERKVHTFQTQLEKRAVELEDRVETVEMILNPALERKVHTFQTQLEKRAVELEDRVETVEMILKDDSKKVDSLAKSVRLLQGPLSQTRTIEQRQSTSMCKDFATIRSKEEICFEIKPGVWEKDWKIQGFIGFLNRAEEDWSHKIWSKPFFLGKNGYKVKLGLDLYNKGLNIHFVIMKSENDVILPWPFSNLVTYKVIDQQKNARKLLNQDSVTSLKPVYTLFTVEMFGRPEQEENTWWTCSNLIPLSQLSERCYLLNDTVIINAVIGPRWKDEK